MQLQFHYFTSDEFASGVLFVLLRILLEAGWDEDAALHTATGLFVLLLTQLIGKQGAGLQESQPAWSPAAAGAGVPVAAGAPQPTAAAHPGSPLHAAGSAAHQTQRQHAPVSAAVPAPAPQHAPAAAVIAPAHPPAAAAAAAPSAAHPAAANQGLAVLAASTAAVQVHSVPINNTAPGAANRTEAPAVELGRTGLPPAAGNIAGAYSAAANTGPPADAVPTADGIRLAPVAPAAAAAAAVEAVPAAVTVAAGYVQAAQGSGKEALQFTSWAADLVVRADMAMDAVCQAAHSRSNGLADAVEQAAAAAGPKLQQHRTEATTLADGASAAATAAEQHASKVRTLAQQYQQGGSQPDVAAQLWRHVAAADEAAVWARQQAQVTATLAQAVQAVVSQLLALAGGGGCLVLLRSTYAALIKAGHAAPAAAVAAVSAIRAQMEAKVAHLVESEKAWPITGLDPLDGPGIVRMAVLQYTTLPNPARNSLSLAALQQTQRQLKQQGSSNQQQQQQKQKALGWEQQGFPVGQVQPVAAVDGWGDAPAVEGRGKGAAVNDWDDVPPGFGKAAAIGDLDDVPPGFESYLADRQRALQAKPQLGLLTGGAGAVLQQEHEQALELQLQVAKQLVLDMQQKAAAAEAEKVRADAEAAAAAGEAPPLAGQPQTIIIGGYTPSSAVWARKMYTQEVRVAHKQIEEAVEELQMGTGSAEALLYCRAIRAVLIRGSDAHKVIIEAHNKAKKALALLW